MSDPPAWPYKAVMILGPFYECGVCFSIVVNKAKHTEVCGKVRRSETHAAEA